MYFQEEASRQNLIYDPSAQEKLVVYYFLYMEIMDVPILLRLLSSVAPKNRGADVHGI